MFKFGVEGAVGGGPSGDDGYSIDIVGAGAKRRHAVMMMLDSAPSPLDFANDADFSVGSAPHSSAHSSCTTGAISTGRRRTRSTRSNHNHSHTQGHGGNGSYSVSEAMDVEEEGRERKRLARR